MHISSTPSIHIHDNNGNPLCTFPQHHRFTSGQSHQPRRDAILRVRDDNGNPLHAMRYSVEVDGVYTDAINRVPTNRQSRLTDTAGAFKREIAGSTRTRLIASLPIRQSNPAIESGNRIRQSNPTTADCGHCRRFHIRHRIDNV